MAQNGPDGKPSTNIREVRAALQQLYDACCGRLPSSRLSPAMDAAERVLGKPHRHRRWVP